MGENLEPVGTGEGDQGDAGLFGHVHEGKGAVHIGRTLCINPGSMYEQGRLLGAVVTLDKDKVKSYILTTG